MLPRLRIPHSVIIWIVGSTYGLSSYLLADKWVFCRLRDSRIYMHATDQSQHIKQLQRIIMGLKSTISIGIDFLRHAANRNTRYMYFYLSAETVLLQLIQIAFQELSYRLNGLTSHINKPFAMSVLTSPVLSHLWHPAGPLSLVDNGLRHIACTRRISMTFCSISQESQSWPMIFFFLAIVGRMKKLPKTMTRTSGFWWNDAKTRVSS